MDALSESIALSISSILPSLPILPETLATLVKVPAVSKKSMKNRVNITVTIEAESAAGVKAGGRTGMTSLVIGILFLLCLFFSPLATSLPKEIDGAALIYIATLFVRNIVDIEWDDIAESGPAVLAMIAMPFTYSISHGIALAFISYAAIKICTGKINSTSPAIWVIAIASVVSFWVA